ncbi:MAG TPA: sigma-70 family RNA polymerase sigma factor [Solirubrobacterales bacterium]|nr:sigma-70 family RNA polymerase sigma factor [Solirubrobacterales bacterium]
MAERDPSGGAAERSDPELVAALRSGDEGAFASLVDAYSGPLLRLARMYVASDAVAQEVVQETWMGVIRGIDRFEGRSSLRTWIFRILVNVARTRGQREARSVPFSSVADPSGDEPSVDPDRFLGPEGRHPNAWALAPTQWEAPEESLLSGEARSVILEAIQELPPAQREVITLRDVAGWPSREVADALEISDGNQRVLLHRARSKVRTALEAYFGAVEPTAP